MKPGKRRKFPSFVALDRQMLKSKEWREQLTRPERDLYVQLKAKYVGDNNGELCLHYSEIKDLMAPATICSAFKGLEVKGWIEKDHKIGGDFRFVVYYRLTGKYDQALTHYKI